MGDLVRQRRRRQISILWHHVGGQFYWIFSDDKEKLKWMLNDTIEEVKERITWRAEGKVGICRSLRRSIFRAITVAERGNGVQGTEMTTFRKSMGSWWLDGYVCRARRVLLRRNIDRVVSHVVSVKWYWSAGRVMRVSRWESKILRQTFRPRTQRLRRFGGTQEESVGREPKGGK